MVIVENFFSSNTIKGVKKGSYKSRRYLQSLNLTHDSYRESTKEFLWTDKRKTIQPKRLEQAQAIQDFPGGGVGKNPPANSGDTVSIPDPGRSRMPQSTEPHALQQLCRQAATTRARAPRACALQPEKPPQWEAPAAQRGGAPARHN